MAITRAEQHLYISYSRFRNDGKEMEPMFIVEILDKHRLPLEKIVLDPEVLDSIHRIGFRQRRSAGDRKMEEEYISRALDKFVMNVTALNNYLKCPLEFYFRNPIRIPSPKNENTEFGSAVHYALEKLFRKMQDGGANRFPAKEEFINDFNWYMERHRESFTKEQYARRLEYGHTILADYDQRLAEFNTIVSIELNIRNVLIDGVPLKGKLDKLEFDGKSVTVVDYKTGDPDKAKQNYPPHRRKNPLGGDYWRQAVFYKLLVDHYPQKTGKW